jgi:hypothetical protein
MDDIRGGPDPTVAKYLVNDAEIPDMRKFRGVVGRQHFSAYNEIKFGLPSIKMVIPAGFQLSSRQLHEAFTGRHSYD